MTERLLTTRELAGRLGLSGAEVAWTAGLFEGEGTITRFSNGPYERLRLAMTDEDVVRRFHAIVGCGTVRMERQSGDWKPVFSWAVSDRGSVSRLLGLWLPYLGERRAQRAVEALERISRRLDGQGSLDG